MSSDLYGRKYEENLTKMRWVPMDIKTIEVWQFEGDEPDKVEINSVASKDIESWVDRNPKVVSKRKLLRTIRLIVFPTLFQADCTVEEIPFERRIFEKIIKDFNLPKPFLTNYTQFSDGTGIFASFLHPKDCVSYICQGPDSMYNPPRRMSVAVTQDMTHSKLTGLIGVNSEDTQKFISYVENASAMLSQPLLIPTIMCELSLDQQKIDLTMTGWSLLRVEKAAAIDDMPINVGEDIAMEGDFGTWTKRLNGICTELSYLEDRISALIAATEALDAETEFVAKAFPKDCTGRLQDEKYHAAAVREYAGYVLRLQRRSCDRVRRQDKRARNAVPAVLNLMTQRDTRMNIEVARDSKAIAAASRRDSSAMKSIAVVTIVFLPGTFVSTLFSMPMFDWQNKSGKLVVSRRFYIYWAITVPLTIVTILIWVMWMRKDALNKSRLLKEARASAGSWREKAGETEQKDISEPESDSDSDSTKTDGIISKVKRRATTLSNMAMSEQGGDDETAGADKGSTHSNSNGVIEKVKRRVTTKSLGRTNSSAV
ncbi:MAG: hypothetical protein M1825_003663 [Sarcosagium campestre]|nr:MAG: hypothetical protein M1825_003663 [Sarcosagium campestre]